MPQPIWDGYFTGTLDEPTALPVPIDCLYVRMVMKQDNAGRVWIGSRPDIPAPIPTGSMGDWNQSPLNPGPNRTKFTGVPYRKDEHIEFECTNSGQIWIDVENTGDGFHYTIFGNPGSMGVTDVMANRMDSTLPMGVSQPDATA